MPYTIYAGACRADGGITKYCLSDEGKLRAEKELDGYPYVMYMTLDGGQLYYVRKFESGVKGDGCVGSCSAAELGDVAPEVSTGGKVPCQLTRFRGASYAVNYLSGSVCKVAASGAADAADAVSGGTPEATGAARSEGTDGKADGPEAEYEFRLVVHEAPDGLQPGRQDAPHTHCVTAAPDGEALMVTDLGLDTVTVCDADLNTISVCRMPAGHGVRHLVCGNGGLVYSANELAATASVLKYDSEGKTLSVLGTYAAFPEGNPEGNTFAAIRLSADKRFLYASNRGQDVISRFALVNGGTELELLENTAAEGLIPWDFDLTPDNKFMVVACKGSGLINVFQMDNGRIGELCCSVQNKDVICVLSEK